LNRGYQRKDSLRRIFNGSNTEVSSQGKLSETGSDFNNSTKKKRFKVTYKVTPEEFESFNSMGEKQRERLTDSGK
jgi:hypothetical protein